MLELDQLNILLASDSVLTDVLYSKCMASFMESGKFQVQWTDRITTEYEDKTAANMLLDLACTAYTKMVVSECCSKDWGKI